MIGIKAKAECVGTATRPSHPSRHGVQPMTDQSVPHQDYYVYALFREDGITPFYIGKGRRHRIKIHRQNAWRGSTHKDRIIQSMLRAGNEPIGVKLVEGLSDEVAKQIEIDLIYLLGRYPKGPLTNVTSGGDGVSNIPAESRERQRQGVIRYWAEASPEKRAEALQHLRSVRPNAPLSVEARERISAATKERWDKIGRKVKIKRPSKDRMQELAKFWADPERREACLEKRRAYRRDHPISKEAVMKMAARLHSPEVVAKSAATNRRPEVSEKRRAAQRLAFSTPEAKRIRSEASKKMWALKKSQKTDPDANGSESKP